MAEPLPNDKWWHKHVHRLVEQAEPFASIQPEQVYPKPGLWPVIKLVFMKNALGIYGPIMSGKRAEGGWDSLHFIDLCAGSGLTRLQGKSHDKSIVVTGTSLIGAHEKSFDHYHFVEIHKASALALQARLQSHLPNGKFTVYNTDAKKAVSQIVENINSSFSNPHYAAFLDPEGLTEITLPALQPLFDMGRGDFLINYQYQAVRRVTPAIATNFFGDDGWSELDEAAIRKYFLDRLSSLGRPKSVVIPVVAGEGSGRYAYDIVYCAAETKSGNPWLQNFKGLVNQRLGDLNGALLERILFGGQRTLF